MRPIPALILALFVAGLLCQPALAWQPNPDYYGPSGYAHALCAEIAATDLVEGYGPESFSTNGEGQYRGPFVDFAVAFINQSGEWNSDRLLLPGVTVSFVRYVLATEFDDYLEVLSVRRAPMHSRADLEAAERLQGIAELLGQPLRPSELAQLMAEKRYARTELAEASPYDDVPVEDPIYSLLDRLTTSGAIEGYPPGFFNGSRTLTRYEFAQAVARLADSLPRLPRDVALARLETATVSLEDVVVLYGGLRDQLHGMFEPVIGYDIVGPE